MKIVTVIGARPQFIKAAAVSRAIAEHNEQARPSRVIQEIIVHTGQHHDHNMSKVFFQEMRIPRPHHQLTIHGLSHGAMTGRMLEETEAVLLKEKPDAVLVYGDTNTTLAGALAAAKLHIPPAHVESGLRSFDRRMPEEINRIMADHLASWLFCPTDQAVGNLAAEGVVSGDGPPEFGRPGVFQVGDVMLDAAMFYARMSTEHSTIFQDLAPRLGDGPSFVLCTVHRAENTDDPERLASIFSALERISRDQPVVLPLHPRTRGKLKEFGLNPGKDASGLVMIEPVGYFDMLELIKHCGLVMTDSGGLQKEAAFFRQACVTLRDETEWVELVEHGCNMVAGTDLYGILAAYDAMKSRDSALDLNLYGAGKASARVVEILSRA